MNWKKTIELTSLALVLLYLGAAAMGPIVSNDVFWHLRTGQDWISNGLSPFVDHYSFTFFGEDIHQSPWPFQSMIYGFVALFGDPLGLKMVRITFFGFFTLWFFTFLRVREASTLVVIFGLVWMALALPMRMHVRPEIVSLFFAPLLISISLRCRDRFSLRDVALLFALQLAWMTVHTSHVFGVVIIGALLIDRLIHFGVFEKDLRKASHMIVLGLLLLGLTFVNRDFESVLADYVLGNASTTELVTEYHQVEFGQQRTLFRAYWVFALTGAVFAVINHSWMTVIVVLVLAIQAWTAQRFSVPLVYLSLPLLLLEAIRFRFAIGASVRYAMLVCVIGTTAWCTVELLPSTVRLFQKSLVGRFPVKVVDRMKSDQLFGNTLADYHVGGYLLYRLAPDVRVFIDGRTNILYPLEFFDFYYQMRQSVEPFNRAHELYLIDQVLTLSDWQRGRRLIHTAIRSGRYSVAFDDGTYSLLRPGDGHFNFTSAVHADPRCWSARRDDAVSAELLLAAEKELPARSQILSFLKFAGDFNGAGDTGAFLRDPESWWGRSSIVLRLAVYLATVNGLYEESLPFSIRLLRWDEPHDRLYMVHALIRLGKHEEAAGYFTSIRNLLTEPTDLFEMYYALGMELFELGLLSESDRQILKRQLDDFNLAGQPTFLDIVAQAPEFCR